MRIAGLILATVLVALIWYTSRYWDLALWPREGLFGVEAIRPQGDLVTQWTQGSPLRPYNIVLWAIGWFLVLSFVQWLLEKVRR